VTIISPVRPPVARTTHFDELVRAHAGAISSYLRRRIYPLPASDVDDLLAETLLIVWRRLDDIPQDAELPWMLGVARRVLANAQRSQRRRLPRESVAAPLSQSSAEDVILADAALASALAALSTDERDILLASVWDGLSYGDIAVLYNITPNAAAIRLSRSREKFLQAYDD
jgi:RNA polymerase sigma-70 factor, ECF subfamily